LVIKFNNLIISYGKSNHIGFKVIDLPVTYTTKYVCFASVGDWTANNSYSICCKMETVSKIVIDKWFGGGAQLDGICSFLTIGY